MRRRQARNFAAQNYATKIAARRVKQVQTTRLTEFSAGWRHPAEQWERDAARWGDRSNRVCFVKPADLAYWLVDA
jgi:hypothetical protein